MKDPIPLNLVNVEMHPQPREKVLRRPRITTAIVTPHQLANQRLPIFQAIQKDKLVSADPGQLGNE